MMLRGDGITGTSGSWFNEVRPMSMTATVSATPHDKILKSRPFGQRWPTEASMIDLVLRLVQNCSRRNRNRYQTLDEKGSAEEYCH